ncbi:hypothetical protein [Methylobacter sp.]|uniref:hypothetical protein n=1 Tax=Methylobacter sp. TaxID=2051955 RepID=UPI00248992FA|nr:hypothetical protein [Methylobacter sp.]MDI1279399.1 hypothetical protein [Methylobacter sp.]MDI1360148.1 hypothetical protein [Methylobacter sp.]
MKRNKIIEVLDLDKLTEHKQRVAFHEAGHAAGIHLNNKARKLPPVFFKIIFKDMGGVTDADVMAYQTTHDDCIARVEGGRLIESLPPSIDSLVRELTKHNDAMMQLVKDYTTAFEADIINLLIGPLAEAKHVAETDDELFNHQLVNLKALKNYGGSSDLALANEYLQSFSTDKQQRDEKLDELFTIAFDFVNNDANWAAITQLAEHIRGGSKNIIDCEEIVSMLDRSVDHFQNRRSVARHHHNG